LFGVTAALCLVICSDTKPAKEAAPAPEVRRLLGDRTLAILNDATRVEVFRLKPERVAQPDGAKKGEVGGFPILSAGKTQDARFAARIASVLRDKGSYEFDRPKGCLIRPGVAFRLWKGKESVEVVLCFECDILVVIARDEDGKEAHRASKDFDPGRPALMKLAKDAFPDDREIQSLK
jgi:hypothetical protein